MNEKINPAIYKQIQSQSHYLAKNSIIPKLIGKNFIEHYSEKKFLTTLLFLKRAFNVSEVTPTVYNSLQAEYKSIIEEIEQHERTLLPKLEKIAENLVKDYFNINGEISFEIKIEDNNLADLYSDPVNSSEEEFANYLEIVERSKKIDRERFNYAFIVGAANECTNNIYNYIHYIDELNPKLSEAYRKYIALNNFNVWVTPDAILEEKYNKKKYFHVLDMGGEDKVFVYAPNFIIALNQTFLAVFSILSGISSFNSDQIVSYASPWNIRVGDMFWSLFKKHFSDNKKYKYFFKEISNLPDKYYIFLFREILASTKLSKELCSKIITTYNKKYG